MSNHCSRSSARVKSHVARICAPLLGAALIAGGIASVAPGATGAIDAHWVKQAVPTTAFASPGSLAPTTCVAHTTFCIVIELDSAVVDSSSRIGDAALVTTDGTTWTQYATLPFALNNDTDVLSVVTWLSASCNSSTDCWIAGSGPNDQPELAQSTDGGQTWTLETPSAWSLASYSWWPNSVDCVTSTTCWLAGTDADSLQDPVAAVTTNGGQSWTTFASSADSTAPWVTDATLPTVVSSDPNGTYGLNGISCVSALSCVAVGGLNEADGTAAAISTTNGGATWSLSPDPALSGIQQLFAISCLAAPSGLPTCTAAGSAIAAAGPVVLTSLDGGTTWSGNEFLAGTGWLDSISCVDANNCWTAGAGTTLSLAGTADGGQSWQPTYADNSNQEGVVSCANIDLCVATTATGLYVTTDDGGLSTGSIAHATGDVQQRRAAKVTQPLPVVTLSGTTARAGKPYAVTGKDYSRLAHVGQDVSLTLTSPTGVKTTAVVRAQLNYFYSYAVADLAPGSTKVTASISGLAPSSIVVEGFKGAAPVVRSIKPGAGPLAGGNTVTIAGKNLTGATSVKFGSRLGTRVKVLSDDEVTVRVPAGSGELHVTVVTAGGGANAVAAAAIYTYAASPVIERITPSSGNASGGNTVHLDGPGLVWALKVEFGTHSATDLKVLSADAISVKVPAGTGTVKVVVLARGGKSAVTKRTLYRY